MNWDIFLLSDPEEIVSRIKEYGIFIDNEKQLRNDIIIFKERIKDYPDRPDLSYTRDEILEEAINHFPITNNTISYSQCCTFRVGYEIKTLDDVLIGKEYKKQQRKEFDKNNNEVMMTPYYYINE